MIKLIILVIALGIGFGGGVWWATKNPDAASQLSNAEQKQVLQAQVALLEKFKAKLAAAQASSSSKAPGSSFLGVNKSTADSDMSELQSETDKQENALQAQLAKLK